MNKICNYLNKSTRFKFETPNKEFINQGTNNFAPQRGVGEGGIFINDVGVKPTEFKFYNNTTIRNDLDNGNNDGSTTSTIQKQRLKSSHWQCYSNNLHSQSIINNHYPLQDLKSVICYLHQIMT